MSPSVRRKPTASSASEPGVRIVTATGTGAWPGPAARISIGSSPASVSGRSWTVDPRTARTWAPETWRSGRVAASEGSSGTPAVYAAAAMTEPILTPEMWRFLAETRRATLATIDDAGRPRLVPICFVLSEDPSTGAPTLHTPLEVS